MEANSARIGLFSVWQNTKEAYIGYWTFFGLYDDDDVCVLGVEAAGLW